MNEILYKLSCLLFLSIVISCSSSETDIAEENNSLNIKRMIVGFETGHLLYDGSNIDGWQRNDTLASTHIDALSSINAGIRMYEQVNNEKHDLTVYLERYSRRYQIFLTPIDIEMSVAYNDTDHDGLPLGLRWSWRTKGLDSGFLNVVVVEDLDKSNPLFQEGIYDGSSGTVIFEMTFPVQVGRLD